MTVMSFRQWNCTSLEAPGKCQHQFNPVVVIFELLQPMTQQPPVADDINIEEVLRMFNTVKGCTGYVVFNAQGIPIKKSPNITPQKALQEASLVQDLWNVTRKVVVNDLKAPDNALEVIRIRTKHYYQYIITQSPTGEVTLMATQNCVVNEPEKVVENKEVPKEQAQQVPKEEA